MFPEIVVALILSLSKPKTKVELEFRTEDVCLNVSKVLDKNARCKSEVDKEIEKTLRGINE